MPPDPTQLPGDLYAGPYGFLVAIVFFLFLGLRELRRYRQIDVQTYQADIKTLRAEQLERDRQHREEVAGLKDDNEDLKAEIGALRDQSFAETRAANAQREALIRENGGLRALLADHNISTEGGGVSG